VFEAGKPSVRGQYGEGHACRGRLQSGPWTACLRPQLAYTYGYGIETPPSAVRPLLAKHEAACAAAGIAVCQVTGSTIEATGKDSVDATLSLRATPAWLTTFRAGIPEDAKSAGGRVVRPTVTSEDLSRQIIDVEATVKAKTALRDRLQALLESRPGKTSDLVEVETALSTAQGELDSDQSELAIARERLATSVVTIDYRSASVFAPDGARTPLALAINGFVGTVIGALAVMVQLIAILLPWSVVIGAVVWFFQRRRRRKPPNPPKI
jgi:hypothetical protein